MEDEEGNEQVEEVKRMKKEEMNKGQLSCLPLSRCESPSLDCVGTAG